MGVATDIQKAINMAIASADYQPPLPDLDVQVWKQAFDWNNHYARNNILEFLGDSLISAAVAAELCSLVSGGNPKVFTAIKGCLVSNQTFALLAHKMDIAVSLRHPGVLKPQLLPPSSKCFADLFEVIVAEVYSHGGFEVLRTWIAQVFSPLIKATISVYTTHPFTSQKRKRLEGEPEAREGPANEASGSGCMRRKITHNAQGTMPSWSWSGKARRPLGLRTKRMMAISKPHGTIRSAASVAAPSRSTVPAPRMLTDTDSHISSAHSASSRALTPASSVPHGLPSRPICPTSAAAPRSARAWGPGTSRSDPIVIGLDDEDSARNAEECSGPGPGTSREVIEISDDSDSD